MDGRREILGITVMPSEAGAFRSGFLRSLTRRGLRGVRMLISDAHEGLKAGGYTCFIATVNVNGGDQPDIRERSHSGTFATQFFNSPRVHFQRNLLTRVNKANKPVISALVKTVFAETDRDRAHAHARWRKVADNLRDRFRDVAGLMAKAEHDVLADMAFNESLRSKLHRTNPRERVNKEIRRRTNIVGIFPNRDAVIRFVGASMLEQNDKWAVRRRYIPVEKLTATCIDTEAATMIAAQ
ncbi:transposase [uncultured Jannaschia sp.]|uniref:transposase n=1 Tax=uncultured Jannaschia sp. TaxID=293347 RepID=UPI0026204C03|nr:transposase [uncultured Jannaschia sp.]